MSISKTTDQINGLTADIEEAINCERLTTLIEEHVKEVTDMISSQGDEIASLMGIWNPLTSYPSDPLKILKWVRKVVGGPITAQITAAVALAIEMATAAQALVGLISAINTAQSRLQSCLEQNLLNTLRDLENSLFDQASKLIDEAESIRDQFIDDIGLQDVLDDIDNIQNEIDSTADAANAAENAIDNLPAPGSD